MSKRIDSGRRSASGALAVALLAATLMAGGAATAAPPTLPPCAPAFTENPLQQNYEVPQPDGEILYLSTNEWAKGSGPCVGARLEGWVQPVLPSRIELNREMTFAWNASCGARQGGDCLQTVTFEIVLYKKGQDGKLVAIPWETDGLSLEFVPESDECVYQVCEKMILRSATGTVPKDLVAMVGAVGRTPFWVEYDDAKIEYGLPWKRASAPVVGAGGSPGIDLTLTAYGPSREYSLDRMITLAQTQTVELTLTNESDAPLTNLAFTGGEPLVIDPRGTGGLEIVSGPTPPIPATLSLDAGEEKTFTFELQATHKGVAAAHSQVVAVGADGVEMKEGHSLKYDIEDGVKVTREVGQWLRMQAMDQLMRDTFGVWYEEMAARGEKVAARLSAIFTPEERLRWFGSETGLPLSPTDLSIALLRGTAPQMIAALMPKEDLDGHTAEELEDAYDATFKAEVGKGVRKYVQGFADLASGTQKFLTDSWTESMLTASYVIGSATPDERAQFEAYAMTLIDGTAASTDNLVNTVKTEIPKWQENGTYAVQALEQASADGGVRGALRTLGKIKEAFDEESAARDQLLKLASTNPMAFQRQWAKRDAAIMNKGLVPIFDTLLGGAVFKGAGVLKGVIVGGDGAAIMRTGRAAGVLEEGGKVVKGPASAIELADDAVPTGLSNGAVEQLESAGSYLDDVEGATIVQSSDLGNVYELPNVGGVPEATLDAKAGILKELEKEYFEKTGRHIQLAEVLKPSSALRKPGGLAKTELTGAKTGKPAMLDAGAPKDVLAEASVWTGPDPRTLPGFDDLSKLRQKAAIKEWEKAKTSWEAYHNPPPGSKEERLRQCIGQEARVPLDLKPNNAGLQRFVTAEFEEVLVTEGEAQAKLIRVKKYEVEVVDTTRGNQVVNRKTVVDVPEPAPQGPDTDGVAMSKVVGRTPEGKPILEPLNRAEREFVMQRYIDKNIKARRLPAGTAGAINDLAEHGVTLVMDDASAKAAGKLLPMFGVPFLPEGVGMAYLKRIAPFVSAKNASPAQIEAMYRQMVELVHSEGGFAQHAVVVTSDSRYLGEVAFASW